MLDYALLARAKRMLADEATELHALARDPEVSAPALAVALDTIGYVVTAEACDYAAQSLHNVLAKADAFLDDEQAREALRHE
jgi:hypothetical protein